ncbi:MAG: prephenate dehydratase domain-containing protein [Candidatus Saccharibacteria bacterium]
MSELIGIQGGRTSYHEAAANQLQPDAELVYKDTFSDVFAALEAEKIDGALVAIANNRVQQIPDPDEYITSPDTQVSITAETYLRIGHALLVLPGTKLEDIRTVHSQAPALGQCSHFLEGMRGIRKAEEDDTALSAKIVADGNDPTHAAIASEAAGELYGLEALLLNIQDDPANITRFIKLQLPSHAVDVPEADKTTIMLTTPQTPGALADALVLFKEADISLMNLQSRNIANSAFEMQFFLEFAAGIAETRSQEVLTQLRTGRYIIKLLGSYKAGDIPMVTKENYWSIHEAALRQSLELERQGKPVEVDVPKEIVMPRMIGGMEAMSSLGMRRRDFGRELAPHPRDLMKMILVARK